MRRSMMLMLGVLLASFMSWQYLQFIFISHNKLAMQIADELKGITMPSAGVSRLVSVSLDEAARYISE